jgi:RNA polymerase sigma factor (sigma-70 family)
MAREENRKVVEELKAGRPSGCRLLVEMYQNRLLNEAMHVFHVKREDAEEVVNDVLLSVVTKIEVFEFRRSEADFHDWVMTIFRNRVRDVFRDAAARGILMDSLEEEVGVREGEEGSLRREIVRKILADYEQSLAADGEEDAAAGNGSPWRRLQAVADALDSMESWERVLLRCRALDVPYEEIARYTDKSVNQLKVYHGRVKKKLIKLLAQHYPELVEV